MTTIATQLDGATNILLEEPPLGHGRDLSTSLLTDGVSEPNVIFVTYTRGPGDCVAQLEGYETGDIGVIRVGEGRQEESGVRTVESVSSPSDLTGLGIKIGQFLSTWPEPVHLSFESLTAMLQYVDFQTAYEFLHAVTGQIHAANARAHFHIDPEAHKPEHVAGLTSLFDAVVTLEGDSYTVTTRKLLES